MTSGGSCRSPSITATHTPRAKLSPAKIAAWCPKLRERLTNLKRGSSRAMSRIMVAVPSVEPSCTRLRLARRRGVDVRAFDVRAGGVLPTAAAVIMQASLYQFHDIADILLPRLWAAARRLLLIAEPVRNVSQSRSAVARWLARILTGTDDRVHTFRYTEATLLELYRRCGIPVSRLDRTPGGREVIVCSVKAP